MKGTLACLKLLDCLMALLARLCGLKWRALRHVRYADVVHDVHTPIMMVGLVALLGVWRDPAHLATAIAAAFGVICVFFMQRLFDCDGAEHQTAQPRRALVAQCRATESNSLTPLEWRCAMSRSGGAPPPMLVRIASGLHTRRHGQPSALNAHGVLFVGIRFPHSLPGGFRCQLLIPSPLNHP